MRRKSIVLLGALAALAMSAALAWACTPQSWIDLSQPTTSPGDTVTVSGKGFVSRPVELRWNGMRGPLLATATGPRFTVNVTIPSGAALGVYDVQAVARTGDGAVIGSPSRPVEVVAPAAASPAAPGVAPATSNAVGAPVAPSTKPTATAPARTPVHQGRPSPVSHGQPAASKPSSISHSSGSGSDRGAATGSGDPAPVPETPGVARGKSGQAVFTGSLPERRARHAAGLNGWNPFTNKSGIPWLVGTPDAVRGATKGNAGRTFGFGERAYPTSQGTSAQPGPPLAIGAGVLGLGVVLLFGGFAVAEARRRRAPAGLHSATTRGRRDRDAPRRFTA